MNDVYIELNNGSILTLNKSVIFYEEDYVIVRQKKSKIKCEKYKNERKIKYET